MTYNSIYIQKMNKLVEDGLTGENVGIEMGLYRFSEYLCGIQKGRYDLVGGHTGTGKTAFVDQNYVIHPLMDIANNPKEKRRLKIFYNSLEISPERKLLKWASYLMLHFDGIYVDSKLLAGRSRDKKLTKEQLESYERARDYLDKKIVPSITFNTKGNIDVMNSQLASYTRNNYQHKIVTINGKVEDVYEANDSSITVLSVTDHNGLSRKDTVGDKKKIIDEKSQNNIKYRNDYGISFVDINQLNRSYGSDVRRLGEELAIQLEDFKETGSTQEDADTVYALFNPNRYNIVNYKGLEIKILRNLYREVIVLKNREGEDGICLHTKFLGKCGMFVELPKLKDIIMQREDFYHKVTNLEYGRTKQPAIYQPDESAKPEFGQPKFRI